MNLITLLCKLNLHSYATFETRDTDLFDQYVSVEECQRCNDVRGRFIPKPQVNWEEAK